MADKLEQQALSELEPAMKELQFAVNMTCQSCADAISRVLASHQPAGQLADIRIDLSRQRVLLKTSLHVDSVLELLESTGCRAVLQGVGTASSAMSGQDFAAGVAQLDSQHTTTSSSSSSSMNRKSQAAAIRGVVRILQPDDSQCLFDGTVDGLEAGGWYSVEMRQGGDLSGGLESCGPLYDDRSDRQNAHDSQSDPTGRIGRSQAGPNGRLRFSLISKRLQLWNLVGRCLSISESHSADGPDGAILAAGVVARSAGLFANDKRICSCDGVEIWNERDVPTAGFGRAAAATALRACDRLQKQ